MIILALSETHTLWQVAVGIGAVVVLVVIALLTLLVRLVQDIESGVVLIADGARQVAANTTALDQLPTTATALGEIREEALIHYDFLAKS